MLVESPPIDYLNFASPVSGLGSKMGLDPTNKWPGETQREWGKTIVMDAAVKAKAEALGGKLGLFEQCSGAFGLRCIVANEQAHQDIGINGVHGAPWFPP